MATTRPTIIHGHPRFSLPMLPGPIFFFWVACPGRTFLFRSCIKDHFFQQQILQQNTHTYTRPEKKWSWTFVFIGFGLLLAVARMGLILSQPRFANKFKLSKKNPAQGQTRLLSHFHSTLQLLAAMASMLLDSLVAFVPKTLAGAAPIKGSSGKKNEPTNSSKRIGPPKKKCRKDGFQVHVAFFLVGFQKRLKWLKKTLHRNPQNIYCPYWKWSLHGGSKSPTSIKYNISLLKIIHIQVCNWQSFGLLLA